MINCFIQQKRDFIIKHAKIIIIAALSLGIFSSNFNSEISFSIGSSLKRIISSIASWSNTTHIFISTAAIVTLFAIYQKIIIKKWLNDVVEKATLSKKTQRLLKSVNIEEIPWDENYNERVKNL